MVLWNTLVFMSRAIASAADGDRPTADTKCNGTTTDPVPSKKLGVNS